MAPRSLGFWRSWALVVGSMIGNGVFMLPALLAPYGSYSLLGWLCSGLGTLLIALMLAAMARRMPRIGGPYAYTHAVFGDAMGFFVGWGHWISYVAASAAGAVAFVGYSAYFLPQFGSSPALGAVLSLVVIWLVTGINMSGMRSAGVFQLVTTLLKLLPLFLIAGGGIWFGDLGSVPATNPNHESLPLMVAGMVMITMWAFVGIENVTIPAEDVINPTRTIPRALVTGAVTAMVVYVVATMGVMALVPTSELAASTSPFADAAGVLLGSWGGAVVAVGAIISILGALNGNVLATGMLSRAIALDKLFPSPLAKLNSRGVPGLSLLCAGLLATVLVGMNYTRGLVQAFEMLIFLSTLTTLLPYACSAVGLLVLQRRERNAGGGFNWVTLAVALGALGFSLFAIVGGGLDVMVSGLVLLAAGVPLYWWQRRTKIESQGMSPDAIAVKAGD